MEVMARYMKAIPVEDVPAFHSVPLMKLLIDARRITLMVDCEKKQRVCLRFAPYQAIKITTEDCFLVGESGVIPFRLCVVEESLWIVELKNALEKVDHDATFLENAKHFILITTQGVVEIVATKITKKVVKRRK